MLTGALYRESLRDGRSVYLDGRQVEDVTVDPMFSTAVDWVAGGYDSYYDPTPGAINPLFRDSRTKDDLRARVQLILEGGGHGSDFTIGTTNSSILGLLTAAPALVSCNSEYGERIKQFLEHCRRDDIRLAEAITDTKGNRVKRAREQAHADHYVRITRRTSEGVFVSGAKLHVTAAAIVQEIFVMPTKRFHPGEEDYAVSFAVPVATDGITIVNATYRPRSSARDNRDYPVSGRIGLPEAMVIFDDVFVPYERVFLDGHVTVSGTMAHSLGVWERMAGLAYMVKEAEELVGLAELIAEANGLAGVQHIRDKITGMSMYATVLSATLIAAVEESKTNDDGLVYPSELYSNVGKYLGAEQYHNVVRDLVDIAGGSVVTVPSMAEFDNPEVADYMEKYWSTSTGADANARYRAQLFHAIRDVTSDAFGGWRQVSNVLSGGGLRAQRLVARKHFDMDRAKERALALIEGLQ
jgi:4-hydroxybutyryl-CoA dehydratase/vinylacetyl-CoA-Delta-isomerase